MGACFQSMIPDLNICMVMIYLLYSMGNLGFLTQQPLNILSLAVTILGWEWIIFSIQYYLGT
jgi:hypothetical protein